MHRYMHAFQSRHPAHTTGNKLSTICQHATPTKGWSGPKGSHLLCSKPGPKCRCRAWGQGYCILVRAESCSHSQKCREPQRMCVRGGATNALGSHSSHSLVSSQWPPLGEPKWQPEQGSFLSGAIHGGQPLRHRAEPGKGSNQSSR